MTACESLFLFAEIATKLGDAILIYDYQNTYNVRFILNNKLLDYSNNRPTSWIFNDKFDHSHLLYYELSKTYEERYLVVNVSLLPHHRNIIIIDNNLKKIHHIEPNGLNNELRDEIHGKIQKYFATLKKYDEYEFSKQIDEYANGHIMDAFKILNEPTINNSGSCALTCYYYLEYLLGIRDLSFHYWDILQFIKNTTDKLYEYQEEFVNRYILDENWYHLVKVNNIFMNKKEPILPDIYKDLKYYCIYEDDILKIPKLTETIAEYLFYISSKYHNYKIATHLYKNYPIDVNDYDGSILIDMIHEYDYDGILFLWELSQHTLDIYIFENYVINFINGLYSEYRYYKRDYRVFKFIYDIDNNKNKLININSLHIVPFTIEDEPIKYIL